MVHIDNQRNTEESNQTSRTWPTEFDVSDLMNVNAGDEHHEEENWQECGSCKRSFPADYDECPWGCSK